MTNTVSLNVTNVMLINSDDQKIRYEMGCCILHTFLLMIVSQFIIAIFAIITQNISQNKNYWHINITKMEKNNELKKVGIKIVRVIFSMT